MKRNITLEQLKKDVAKFVKKRDWGQYHSPKNLSMSIAIEAAELMETFQWLSIEESKEVVNKPKLRKAVEDELADIAIYLIDFCDVLNIDVGQVVTAKLKKNSRKYPVRRSKGKALKYSEYRT